MNYKNRISEVDGLKKEVDLYRPFKKEVLDQLKEYYRIGLTYSSNALEGNSLTETETKVVLEDGITIGGKPLKDHFEAIGHSQAYDRLYGLVKKKKISENDVLGLHRLFYYRIDDENAGTYRKVGVIITGTEYIPPEPSKVPVLMKSFIAEIPQLRTKYHPVEVAALLHKEIAAIHPFVDGNGRTARLLMNLALLQSGYGITVIPPVLRNDYIGAIKISQTGAKSDT